ncbi:MAG: DNA-directed RNA polymerase subunit omega [Oscillospiraceae bacterium]|nr:DNA-directed RNA polymerase subunit omega [Oscillospiraceae bacterium]
MLYPPMSSLLKNVNNRYLLVNVIARRARQIAIEHERLGDTPEEKPIAQAIEEVSKGELSARVKDEYK